MKLNVKALTIAFTAMMTTIMLIIAIWSRLSTQFGIEFMAAFNSVHPHPFTVADTSLSMMQQIYGIVLDIFYTLVDSIIFSSGFSLIYNWATSIGQPSKEKD